MRELVNDFVASQIRADNGEAEREYIKLLSGLGFSEAIIKGRIEAFVLGKDPGSLPDAR
jgi:hypothetical protein